MRRNSVWMARLGAVLAALMWQQAPIAQTSGRPAAEGPSHDGRAADRGTLRQGRRSPAESHRTRGCEGLAGESAAQAGVLAGRIRSAGAMPPPWFGGRDFAPASPGPPIKPADLPSAGSAGLYDSKTLRTIFLQFENTEWERELADFNNTDVEVPASLTLDGVTYRDVGVHFRGMSSFMMVPEGSKRSLNLSIDYVHDTQRLLGYRTLNLLNANGDATFLRQVLYTEIARRYVPTPSANYIRVVINGEYWGVYVNTQQFNADFTREWFASTKGARWKVPGSPRGPGRHGVPRRGRRRVQSHLRDQIQGRPGGMAIADSDVPGVERDGDRRSWMLPLRPCSTWTAHSSSSRSRWRSPTATAIGRVRVTTTFTWTRAGAFTSSLTM